MMLQTTEYPELATPTKVDPRFDTPRLKNSRFC